MVTRRAVLKGTAAFSIGAIAAAHGAAPAEAESFLDLGWGQLTGGAIAGFSKRTNDFVISVKFDKASANLFIKEQPTEGIALFYKFFNKHQWSEIFSEPIESEFFKDLQTSELAFAKIDVVSAEFFIKNELSKIFVKIELSNEELFLKLTEEVVEPPPDIIFLE